MTRPELRVFLGEWFCGCDRPDAACERLRDVLRLHRLYDHRDEFKRLIPDDGIEMLITYTLDHFKLTEHGGSVGGSWLSDKGINVLAALERESADDFEGLNAHACMHGYAVEDELHLCPECGPMNQRPRP